VAQLFELKGFIAVVAIAWFIRIKAQSDRTVTPIR
jgi:hypothetical protein